MPGNQKVRALTILIIRNLVVMMEPNQMIAMPNQTGVITADQMLVKDQDQTGVKVPGLTEVMVLDSPEMRILTVQNQIIAVMTEVDQTTLVIRNLMVMMELGQMVAMPNQTGVITADRT